MTQHTLSCSSASRSETPPLSTSAQNVVLYRLLMWPSEMRRRLEAGEASLTVSLAPRNVVFEVLKSRIQHATAVKLRRILERQLLSRSFVNHVLVPVEDIACSKHGADGCHQLACSSTEERCSLLKYEAASCEGLQCAMGEQHLNSSLSP